MTRCAAPSPSVSRPYATRSNSSGCSARMRGDRAGPPPTAPGREDQSHHVSKALTATHTRAVLLAAQRALLSRQPSACSAAQPAGSFSSSHSSQEVASPAGPPNSEGEPLICRSAGSAGVGCQPPDAKPPDMAAAALPAPPRGEACSGGVHHSLLSDMGNISLADPS